jgi:hypothetical protein
MSAVEAHRAVAEIDRDCGARQNVSDANYNKRRYDPNFSFMKQGIIVWNVSIFWLLCDHKRKYDQPKASSYFKNHHNATLIDKC